MTHRVIFTGLLLCVFAGKTYAGDNPVKAPFDLLKTQHIVVMVKINDKGPFRLIFDTGAPFNLVSTKLAEEAGIAVKEGKSSGLNLLGPVPQFKIKTLEWGELKAENLNVMVMDHPTVAAIDKVLGPVQGIIGLTLFGKYKTTIDYQAKEMTFEPVDFTPPDVLKTMMAIIGDPKSTKKLLAPAGQWGFSVTKEDGDTLPGVPVKSVLAGSPADAGGLKVGDRLLTLEGRWTDSVTDCYQAASFVRPGTEARLIVAREGKEVELTVKVAAGF